MNRKNRDEPVSWKEELENDPMSNKNPPLSNLTPFTAPDLEGTGVTLNIRVAPDDKEWLKRQEGGMSYHTRRAIALYRRVMSESGSNSPLDLENLKEALRASENRPNPE